MNHSLKDLILRRYERLARLAPLELEGLLSRATEVELPKNAKIFEPGGPCTSYLLVLEGQVRVRKLSESGREIVLYRVHPGETCVLTTACLLSGEDYGAEAIAETPVRAIAIPRPAFDATLVRSEAFRQFVFHVYSQRIGDLLLLIEEVAFGRMDARLAQRLLQLSSSSPELRMTHQELAAELGTHREVVTRLLKDMESAQALETSRGLILIKRRDVLEGIANSSRM